MPSRLLARLVALVLAAVAVGSVGVGQGLLEALRGGEEPVTPAAEDAPGLEERRADAAARLAELEARLTTARAEERTALVAQLEAERELLRRLQLRQGQIVAAEAELERLASTLEEARLARDAFLASDEPGELPADFFALELARDRLDVERERAANLDNARLAAARQRRLAESAQTAAEREARRAREALARAADAGEEAAARQRLRERELAAEVERELLRVRELEERQAALRVRAQGLVVELERERVARMAAFATFSEEDFLRKNDELDARLAELQARREAVLKALQALEDGEAGVRARIEAGSQQDSDAAELERYRTERGLVRAKLDVVDRGTERVETLRTAWHRRRQLYQGQVMPRECAAWDEEARAWLEDLDIDEDGRIGELTTLRDRLQELQADDAPEGKFFRDQRIAALQATLEDLNGALQDIEAGRRVVQRLRDEIAEEARHVPLGERLRVVGERLRLLWEYELIPLGEGSITVRKVVLGLTIVLFGGWLARRFSRLLGGLLAKRFKVDEGGLAVAQTLTFYVLVLLFVLFALKVVNVPLTAFTIFGGAIAIGVGFGSQNLINNFISGLILLLEQPVRVGDLIQVGDLQGNVERIGARSTVVRTGSNIEIVVPNSDFLEQRVVNWTLSEPRVRVFVRVGVAYGSPTREVARLMRRAAEEHGTVLKNPKPIVLFEDFGDDALVFEVHFWIRMRRVMDRRTVESDVRFILDGLFNEAGIVVAFPQRDVHLDTSRPLDVRLITPDPAPARPGEGADATAAFGGGVEDTR